MDEEADRGREDGGTPRAGVWIEMESRCILTHSAEVTPRAGVWIEITIEGVVNKFIGVTPRAGVWIEIGVLSGQNRKGTHSPCGSVD